MMFKSKSVERLMRLLITMLGAGVGAGIAALLLPPLMYRFVELTRPYSSLMVYAGFSLAGGLLFFLLSRMIIAKITHMMSSVERSWTQMPAQQIAMATAGLILGLVVAVLVTQLLLSAGATFLSITFSAIIYVMLGTFGTQIGYRFYGEDKHFPRWKRRKLRTMANDGAQELLGDDDDFSASGVPPKLLDTSVIIDGRILDIAKTGFLEGDIVIAQFVLAELRHIADSGDGLRRVRGRRGLDVLGKLQKELGRPIVIDETDYEDISEVDVKLLRLCRDLGGVVVTNDYNLNKVAGVTGIKVLNINDLANAVKPMLLAGEELTVQIVREGKEPGQGIAYLDDGTMIVVDNGRRYVGESVPVVVTTVLQTSAGRMIFTRLKSAEEKAG